MMAAKTLVSLICTIVIFGIGLFVWDIRNFISNWFYWIMGSMLRNNWWLRRKIMNLKLKALLYLMGIGIVSVFLSFSMIALVALVIAYPGLLVFFVFIPAVIWWLYAMWYGIYEHFKEEEENKKEETK